MTRVKPRNRLIIPRNRLIFPGMPGLGEPSRIRLKSRWWQRLISGGHEGVTAQDPGCCCGGSGCTCGSCTVPAQNLTVSWTNVGPIGNGSTALTYSGSCTGGWTSACTNQLLYEMVCNGGQVEFRVYYFISGSCPGGQSQYCSTIRSNPFKLTQTGLTCGSSFLLTCSCTSASCPNLAANGYTGFSVSI